MSYPTECKYCKKYVFPDKYCCKLAFQDRDDDSVLVNINPVHFEHETVVYIPVYQRNFKSDGTLESYPTFHYSYADATEDFQMAWSFEPDYVLVLKGTFDATTEPFIITEKNKEKL